MANSQRSVMRSSLLELAVFAFICAVCISATSATYLSPSGTPTWDGNCDAGCANSSEPCGLPSTTISATSATQTCVLSFVAGNYTTPVSITQAQAATKITAMFATDNGGVQGLALSLKAQSVVVTGKVTFGTVTVSIETADSVQFKGLTSTASTFNFVGDSAPTISTAITVSESTFSFVPSVQMPTGKDVVYVFNFEVRGSATPKFPTMNIVDSNVQLANGFSGLVYSTGGSGPSRVVLSRSQVTQPFALVTFKDTTATNLDIRESTVTLAENIFKSRYGVDPAVFDSSKAPLNLFVYGSTVTGKTGTAGLRTTFAPVYDLNGCANVAFSNASVSNLDINCNSPNSNLVKDRCTYEFLFANMTDNHLCIFAGRETEFPVLETNFLISSPTKAPVMTWIRDVTLSQALRTSFKSLPRVDTPAAEGSDPISPFVAALQDIPFLFSGRVKFDILAEIWLNKFTLSAGAVMDVVQVTFSNAAISMRHGASITATTSRAEFTFDGHTSITMDGPGNATIRADRSYSPNVRINVDRWTMLQALPIVDCGAGVLFFGPRLDWFANIFLTIDWNTTRTISLPPTTSAYPLISNAVFATTNAQNLRYKVRSLGGFNFTAWHQFDDKYNYCGPFPCGTVKFGLEKYFPVTSDSPSTTIPVDTKPVASPKANSPSSSHCYGGSDLFRLGFSCVNGGWYYSGNWTVSEHVRIEAQASPVYINGDVNFAGGGEIILTGEHAGIQLAGCLYSPAQPVIVLDYSDGWPKKEHWYQEAIVQSTNCKAERINIPWTMEGPGGCISWMATPGHWMTNGLYINWRTNKNHCMNTLALGLGVGIGVVLLIGAGFGVFFCVRRRRAAAAERKERLGGFSSDYEPLVNEQRRL